VIVFVDTSALLALLDADDRRHADARVAFEWLVRNAELVTHNYVEVEAVAVARRRLSASAVDALLGGLLQVVRVDWVDEALHRDALAAYRSAGWSGSLVDHVSFAYMRRHGLTTAFAFDEDFQREGFRLPTAPASERGRRLQETRAPYGSDHATGLSADLVSVAEIADRSGRPANTVQSWRRRHRDFPTPVAQLAAGPIWSWAAVNAWIDGRRPAVDRA
jgi:predicted nucleic acid-binding protein